MKRLLTLLILVIPVLITAQTDWANEPPQDATLEKHHFAYIQKLMEPAGDVLLEIAGKYSPDQFQTHQIQQLRQFSQKYPMSSNTSRALVMLADLYEQNSQYLQSFAVHLKQIAFFPGTPEYSMSVSKIRDMLENRVELADFAPTVNSYLRREPVRTSYQQSLYRYLFMLHELDSPVLAEWTVDEMQQYIRHFPGAADAARIYLWMGNVHETAGAYPEAIFTYNQAAELYPGSLAAPEALLQAAAVLKEQFNAPNETLSILQTIVESNYQDDITIRATKYMADIYAQSLGQPENALEIYGSIIENYPGRQVAAEAMFAQAKLYAGQLNNPEKAVQIYVSIPEQVPAAREIGAQALRNAGDLTAGVMREYFDALSLYLDFAIHYPWHQDVPDRLMKAAEITEKQYGDPDMTIDLLSVIMDRYPATTTANQAQRRLARYTNANW